MQIGLCTFVQRTIALFSMYIYTIYIYTILLIVHSVREKEIVRLIIIGIECLSIIGSEPQPGKYTQEGVEKNCKEHAFYANFKMGRLIVALPGYHVYYCPFPPAEHLNSILIVHKR